MPTFAEIDASVQDSEPREYFAISINGTPAYRHTSGSHDLVVDGVKYAVIAMDRSEQVVQMPGNSESNMEIRLPIDHPLVRRWVASGTPPKQVTVQVWQRQAAASESILVWVGNVTSVSCEKATAKLNVPSQVGEWMLRTIAPSIGAGCPHTLYSSRCGVSRAGSVGGVAHEVSTTIAAIEGRDVRVDLSAGRSGTWAEDGEVYHAASGERMTVLRQQDVTLGGTVTWLTMQAPIYGLKIGDVVTVAAGCDHTLTGAAGCAYKFENRQNYGGAAFLLTKNIFIPGNYGIRTVT